MAFVDVTRPGIERYAEFPVIEAKFPHDFFYPFMTADAKEETEAKAKETETASNRANNKRNGIIIMLLFFLILSISIVGLGNAVQV